MCITHINIYMNIYKPYTRPLLNINTTQSVRIPTLPTAEVLHGRLCKSYPVYRLTRDVFITISLEVRSPLESIQVPTFVRAHPVIHILCFSSLKVCKEKSGNKAMGEALGA